MRIERVASDAAKLWLAITSSGGGSEDPLGMQSGDQRLDELVHRIPPIRAAIVATEAASVTLDIGSHLASAAMTVDRQVQHEGAQSLAEFYGTFEPCGYLTSL